MKPIKTVNLRGKRFAISRPRRLQADTLGWCRTHGKPKIAVAYSLNGVEELEILIHEMLHGCYWDMDEEAISDTAESIAIALWRLGYKKELIAKKKMNISSSKRKKTIKSRKKNL